MGQSWHPYLGEDLGDFFRLGPRGLDVGVLLCVRDGPAWEAVRAREGEASCSD